MSDWLWVHDGYRPPSRGLEEALTTLGNGYLATRGAVAEASADGTHYPGTYVAGLYDRLETEVAGRQVENEDLVNLPNWLTLTFRVDDGEWFHVDTAEVIEHRHELDLHRGVLTRRARVRDSAGRTTRLVQQRFVHMGDPHILGLRTELVAEDWDGTVSIRSGIDAGVSNAGVLRYRALASTHLRVERVAEVEPEILCVGVETVQSRVRVAMAARHDVTRDGTELAVDRRSVRDGDAILHELSAPLGHGQTITIDKLVAVHTSRDAAISEPAHDACRRVRRAPGFDALSRSHAVAWDQLWRRCDLELDGGDQAQRILRLHLFHLLVTVSENTIDLDVGVPARGWHGEAYRGHIFWDELFILPLLNYRIPVLSQAALTYRHRRLDEARLAAQRDGFRGAMFPWQSGSNGREETQRLHLNPRSGRWHPDRSHRQRHVNHAIVHNVWHHFQVTGDVPFLRFRGGEVMIEIARFLADLATFEPALGRYVIRGVMGPDEFHDGYPDAEEGGLDNNAYTNVMTAWVLARALELFDVLPPYHAEELREQYGLTPDELARWDDVSRRLLVPFHADGIISQFGGYEQLEEFDWEGYAARYGDIQRLDRILEAEGDSPNRYKVSKQADVLMLLYLLSEDELVEVFHRLGYREVDRATFDRTVRYYAARTSHGSTLSRVVESWVLARRDRHRAWDLFVEALHSDVDDIQGGTTAEGIHLGAMAGTVDLIQRGFTGLEVSRGVLRFDPALPDEVHRLAFPIHVRGHRIDLELTPRELWLSSRPATAPPLPVEVRGERIELTAGTAHRFELRHAAAAR